MNDTAHKEKVCREEACTEQWEQLPPQVREHSGSFIYCPFCANEMIIRCSACGEELMDDKYHYCPWCGAHFAE